MSHTILQSHQENMALLFWYIVKIVESVRYCTNTGQWTSLVFQGTGNTHDHL